MEEFILWQFNKKDVFLSEVNHKFMAEYEFYLKSVKKQQHNTYFTSSDVFITNSGQLKSHEVFQPNIMSTTANTNWAITQKIIFRFLFVYFLLYCFPFPIDSFELLDPVAKPYYNFLDWLVIGVGKNWFHLNAHVAFPTFDKVDDSYYGLTFIFLLLIVSAISTLIWSMLDRNRKNYVQLHEWLRLYLRYFLISFLFGYGFVKVFPSQFQEITASRLTMMVGEQSPMLLAWNFMGHSVFMMKLNGLVEVIAGVLLIFRRTTTLGSILSACTFSVIVIMDFSFNVPVRLLASHLFFISIFLIIGDSRRLLNVFILNKPTAAVTYAPLVRNRIWKNISLASLALLAGCLFYSTLVKGIDAERSFGRKSLRVPLYGVYNIAYFLRNKDTIPPIQTDTLRWQQMVIDGGGWNQFAVIRFSGNRRSTFTASSDTLKHILKLQPETDTSRQMIFQYSIPSKDLLLLKGTWDKDSVEILMTKYDLNNYQLYREKFKWISD